MQLIIHNFKTFRQLSLGLKPLTLLIGPPASGKSNLLEALALLGFLGKISAINEQYKDPVMLCHAEPQLPVILRIGDAFEVFPWMDYRSPAIIELKKNGSTEIKVSLTPKRRALYAKFQIPSLDLRHSTFGHFTIPVYDPINCNMDNGFCCNEIVRIGTEISNKASELRKEKEEGKSFSLSTKYVEYKEFVGSLIEARLYGYERYGIESKVSEVTICENDPCMQPHDILAETGYNTAYIASNSPIALQWLEDWLKESIEVPIEIKVRRRRVREIIFYSKGVEISSRLLSDTLLRILYYVLALYSSARYTRSYGLSERMFVLLEEPEAKAFPYSFQVLVKAIREALDAGVYIVLTTHNNLLLSNILDSVRENELAVYYMSLDRDGYSRVTRVDIDTLAKRLLLLEDLLVMKPAEAVRELGKPQEG